MKKAPAKSRIKTVVTKSPSTKSSKHGLGTTIDLMAAVLIVSLLANLFVVCIWVILSVTTQYDDVFAKFFLGR